MVLAATKPLFGKIADTKRPEMLIVMGILLTGISLAVISLTVDLWLLFGIGLVFGTGMSLSTVAANVYAANSAEEKKRGSSLGALSSIMDIGHAGGPVIAGVAITIAGYAAGFQLCCVLAVITAAYVYLGRNVQ